MTAPSGQPRADASEMVERVARAAHFAGEGLDLDSAFAPENDAHWAHWWSEHREEHVRVGRAALEAMREPSEAMIDAASFDYEQDENPEGVTARQAGEVWRAMIDEALREPATTTEETSA